MDRLLILALAVIAFAHYGVAFNPPSIPLGWTTVYPCAVDVPTRVLTNFVAGSYAENTPAWCIERCDTANYTYAGVEFSNECFCGTDLVGTPTEAWATECSMACSGNSTLSCGGPLLMQIYKSLALAPGTWDPQGCFVDTPLTPAFSTPRVNTTFASSSNVFDQCVSYCARIGMPFSGVGNGTECQCSFGLADGAIALPESVCNSTAVETLMVYKYRG